MSDTKQAKEIAAAEHVALACDQMLRRLAGDNTYKSVKEKEHETLVEKITRACLGLASLSFPMATSQMDLMPMQIHTKV